MFISSSVIPRSSYSKSSRASFQSESFVGVLVTLTSRCAGSYVPKIQVYWTANLRPADTEIVHLRFDTLPIHTSMLNRLDAFDKKTGFDIETILELEHATDDETCYPIFNGTKLYEGGGVPPSAHFYRFSMWD